MPKELVWIATPLKQVPAGYDPADPKTLDLLAPHYIDPIRRLNNREDCSYRFDIALAPGGSVARARNRIAARAIRNPDVQWIYWGDYDLIGDPNGDWLLRLLSHKKGCVGALYCTREDEGHWVVNTFDGIVTDPATGLLPVAEIGTGGLLIHRSRLEHIIKTYPDIEYIPDDEPGVIEWGFFSMGCVKFGQKTRWLTEDFWFCNLARQAGIPIYCDTAVQLLHKDGDNAYPRPDHEPDPIGQPLAERKPLPDPVKEWSTDPLENLTVCITSFKRGLYLSRAIQSCHSAGIHRIVVATACPDALVEAALAEACPSRFLSFDVARVSEDIGCNALWMLAAYRSRTDRVIILHDDDMLAPAFGQAYRETIAPALDSGIAGFATWEADLRTDAGHLSPCKFWPHDSALFESKELLKVVGRRGCLSLSPIVSVLDRSTVIQACKEAESYLTGSDSMLRPGMLLGTEIVVYYRHVQKYSQWLYLNQVLSYYGKHDGSGTVQAQTDGAAHVAKLTRGYDLARDLCEQTAHNPTNPRLIFAYSDMPPRDGPEACRFHIARSSWEPLFNNNAIELPIPDAAVRLHPEGVPYLASLLDYAARFAQPEDIILFTNKDIGFALDRLPFPEVQVTAFTRHHPLTGERDGTGYDSFAFTKSWWAENRSRFPDMLYGREGFDIVLTDLLGHITYDACFHEPHESIWKQTRLSSSSARYNRRLLQSYFAAKRMAEAGTITEGDSITRKLTTGTSISVIGTTHLNLNQTLRLLSPLSPLEFQ